MSWYCDNVSKTWASALTWNWPRRLQDPLTDCMVSMAYDTQTILSSTNIRHKNRRVSQPWISISGVSNKFCIDFTRDYFWTLLPCTAMWQLHADGLLSPTAVASNILNDIYFEFFILNSLILSYKICCIEIKTKHYPVLFKIT